MKTSGKKRSPLILQFIGEDFWSRPVYRDQHGHLWKDIELGNSATPILHSAVNNEFEGEPDEPIRVPFIIQQGCPIADERYAMLGRLKSDCEYYLACGTQNREKLYYKDEKKHIEAMKSLWKELPEKPLWLSWEDILRYEKYMESR